MDVQYLRTIIAVLKEKSFSKAAQTLNVTQSAVSHRVKCLEEHYGCRLIDRSGAELIPTDSGLRLLKKAEQMVYLEDELEKELTDTCSDRKFSIGSTVAFAVNHMSKIMNDYFLSHSDGADLMILIQHPKSLLDGLKSNFFDIAVIEHNGNLDFSGLKSFELPDDKLVFISNRCVDLSSYQSPLAWLLDNWIITRVEGCSCRDVLTENLQKCSLQLTAFKGVVVCDDLKLTIESVLAGKGIAFISSAIVKEYIDKELLYEYTIDGFNHTRKVTVAFKQEKNCEDKLQVLLSSILDNVKVAMLSAFIWLGNVKEYDIFLA